MRSRRVNESAGDKVFDVINYIVLTFMFLLVLYPLVYVVSASFSDAKQVLAGRVYLWPVGFTLDGYKAVFRHPNIVSGFSNAIMYTVAGTLLNVFMTMIGAYPLSRKDFYGRNVIMLLFTITMFINGGLIPSYLLVKNLGMINTRWSMIIPGALSVWNLILTRTFLQANIPDELLEASKMDGCNDITFLLRIVLPLSAPILAVITLYYAIGHWNEFFSAMLYLSDSKLYPLQLVLREILVKNQLPPGMMIDPILKQQMDNIRELLKYSLIVVATVPVMVIYPFVQKHFVKGVMIGAIKG